MSSQLKAMAMKMSTQASYMEIMKGLEGSTGVMSAMNDQMDISSIQTVLKNFNKESMKAEFKQEAMNDAMEMGMGGNVEEEADDVYNGILGEIGLEYQIAGTSLSKQAIPAKKTAAAEEQKSDASDDLEARLAALKM
jgi:hypothetical protein